MSDHSYIMVRLRNRSKHTQRGGHGRALDAGTKSIIFDYVSFRDSDLHRNDRKLPGMEGMD